MNRLLPLLLFTSGCAQQIWDRRQVQCDELDRVEYSTEDTWPLYLSSSKKVDEECEAKAFGLRDATLYVEDTTLVLEDVHKLEFEISTHIFGSPEAYPVLDVGWEVPTEASRVTGLDFNRVDLSYGPTIQRLYLESEGWGELSYGDALVEGSSVATSRSDLLIDCEDCFVNARVDGSIQVSVNGLPSNRACEPDATGPDSGLCTRITFANRDPLPAHEICVGPLTRDVRFFGGPEDNLKLIILSDAPALESIAIDTEGVVALVAADLRFEGRGSGTNITQVGLGLDVALTNLGGIDLSVDLGFEELLLVGVEGEAAREELCQLGLPFVEEDF